MANTGYVYSASAHATHSTGTDIDGVAVADNGTLTSDEISGATKVSTEISFVLLEDNTGAIDGVVTVSILRSDNDPDSEGWQVRTDPVMQLQITPIQNATVRKSLTIHHATVSDFKIDINNTSGQELAVTINYRQSDIPAAA